MDYRGNCQNQFLCIRYSCIVESFRPDFPSEVCVKEGIISLMGDKTDRNGRGNGRCHQGENDLGMGVLVGWDIEWWIDCGIGRTLGSVLCLR